MREFSLGGPGGILIGDAVDSSKPSRGEPFGTRSFVTSIAPTPSSYGLLEKCYLFCKDSVFISAGSTKPYVFIFLHFQFAVIVSSVDCTQAVLSGFTEPVGLDFTD